jgi:hypothetical protein
MIFIGYTSTGQAYRLWNPALDIIVESVDVRFDEKAGKIILIFFQLCYLNIKFKQNLYSLKSLTLL